MDSPANPIPEANKALNVGLLVTNEKRAGLKNLHIVNAKKGTTLGTALEFYGATGNNATIRFVPGKLNGWTVGLMLPKSLQTGITGNAGCKGGWMVFNQTFISHAEEPKGAFWCCGN